MKPSLKVLGKSLGKTAEKFSTPQKTDPLYIIFEQHLLNFQDSDADRKTFIGNIVLDYLSHLRRMNITVPKSLEQPIMDELAEQVNTILVKKIYGCFNIQEYQKTLPPTVRATARKRAKAKYNKLSR